MDDVEIDALLAQLPRSPKKQPSPWRPVLFGLLIILITIAAVLVRTPDTGATKTVQGSDEPAWPPALCGNHKVETGEDCDDGPWQPGAACPADCLQAPTPSSATP
jgi:cysteine-rich repeat protein